ncbi:hypothetical protein HO173_013137 [Letharia columbiana]|uniref:F-box domain-containing protein n=1 Tax=Letharia columbiana TaxID=112416 RepID=A0A8H6FD85_9LECA|nr:uncharacterized protein HO173_013137 [Letharia columbiana]KAF6223806.1 hypothetical protein HO173_013137 [Letharia columbiana]
MPTSINNLPYELFSAILEETAELNIQGNPQYTYGLSQAPEPLQDVRMQRVVRGQVSPDTRKWNAVDAIRQVNQQCHQWASEYALRSLFITRWRGSERWMQSRTLHTVQTNLSSIAVYRDPYHSLRKTLQLFESSSALACCVRRISFVGYYGAETNAMIFGILRRCTKLEYVTLPWTALRYGSTEDWSRLLGRNENFHSISSLELLAVDLKQSQIDNAKNQIDNKPLSSPRVDFSALKRLKIFGQSNFMPLTDDDLIAISHTAVNLRELHITGTASVTIDGIGAIANSSDETLEILEHSPLTADGFEHPDPTSLRGQKQHLCPKILECPRLRNLSLSLPSICEHLFADTSVNWSGEMQIRTSTVCGRHPISLKTSKKSQTIFWRILEQARSLMSLREKEGVELDVEIFINNWIFEPRCYRVHGDLNVAEVVSDGSWPQDAIWSSKGPYGRTGLYGKDEGPYQVVSEDVFKQGLSKHYVSF